MLDSPDYKIITLVFPYGDEDPWAVRVTFQHRRNGKKVDTAFNGEADYRRVAEQARRQISLREPVAARFEEKPKFRPVVAAPAPIKGKGKKKG